MLKSISPTRSILFGALLTLAACENSDPIGPTPPPVSTPSVAQVSVQAQAQVVPVGSTLQLTASARDAAGHPLARPFGWESTDASVAIVSASGIVTARSAGVVVISATAEGVTGGVELRVVQPPQHVLVLPGGQFAAPGQTIQLAARGLTAAGDTVFRPATWSSENAGVATVDSTGRVTARRAGSAVIVATMDGVVGRTIVFVTGPRTHALTGVAGSELPASVLTRTVTTSNGVRTQQLVVNSGELRLADGGYTQIVKYDVVEAGSVVGTEQYEDSGRLLYDVFTGDSVFESTRHTGLRYRGQWLYSNGLLTGEVVVVQVLPGTQGEQAFRFGRT